LKRETLTRAVNDASRKITIRGRQAIVPLKFDAAGNLATDATRIFKRLTIDDLRFLQVWRECEWDTAKARERAGLPQDRIEKLVAKLAVFRQEDAQVRALCEIPTPDWIKAKHVENAYLGGRDNKSKQKSLEELAKMEGAYKQTAPTNQLNVFNISLTPEQEATLKPVFDTLAMDGPHAA